MNTSFDENTIGHLFMVGLPGLELDESTIHLVRHHRIHNFILFKRNITTPAQLKRLCNAIKQLCLDEGLPLPLISIDQEGGSVARLPPPFSQFDDARVLATEPNAEEKLRSYARTCAQELLSMGINMNLAPVLDVCPTGEGCVMEKRCLSDDPQEVARMGKLILTEMQQQGVAACAKHFPGLGCVTLDPHLDLPIVTNSREHIQKVDLIPFKEAMAADVAAVMTSHTVYIELDAQIPATLSAKILTDLLRRQLGYNGLVITDDLEMGAIEKQAPVESAAVEAFMAGADLLLICHDHNKVIRTYEALSHACRSGDLAVDRIMSSVARIEHVGNIFTHTRQTT